MPAIRRRASVSSRAEEAFEYVADWRNFSNYIPMFVDLEASSLVQYGPGTSVGLTMLIGTKARMRTSLDIADFVKGRRIVFTSSRGMRTRAAWDFKDVGGKALVTLDFEFEIPGTMGLREGEKEALARATEDAWGKSLDMLKWILEAKHQGKA
jgi:ribosome-associated toxin RatA of RatAB toxin-antitoxin module